MPDKDFFKLLVVKYKMLGHSGRTIFYNSEGQRVHDVQASKLVGVTDLYLVDNIGYVEVRHIQIDPTTGIFGNVTTLFRAEAYEE